MCKIRGKNPRYLKICVTINTERKNFMTEKEFFNTILAIENVPVEVKEYAETGLIKLKEHNKNRMIAAAEIGKTLEDIFLQI